MTDTWDPDKIRIQLARDLREIKRMFGNVRDQAIANAADKDMPGGDAMVLLGVSADPEAWTYREMSEIFGRIDGWALDEDPGDPSVLFTLARWVDVLRAEREQPTDLDATIDREADYILASVDWMLSEDADGDMNFIAIDDLASDIHAARIRLENILKDGERSILAKAKCMYCDASPRVVRRFVDRDRTGRSDFWQCPNRECRHVYDDEGVQRCINHELSNADGEVWLRATEAARISGRSIRTIRAWLQPRISGGDEEPPRVRSRRDQLGNLLVLWSDVRQANGHAATRRRMAS